MKAVDIFTLVSSSIVAIDARLGGSKDCDKMKRENSASFFSEKTAGYLSLSGIKGEALGEIFPASGAVNPKVPMRFVQFVNALHVGQYGQIDATTARALIALRAAGGTLNRDALNMLLTGRIKVEGVCPDQKGVGVRALDRLVGRIGRGTVETQISRSFGVAGFCRALGMTSTVGAVNFSCTLNPDAVFSRRFYTLLDTATENQLDDMLGE